MASLNQPQDQFQGEVPDTLIREVPFSDGNELAFYTLRRLHDGRLQSYMLPLNSNDQHVLAIPIPTQLSGTNLPEKPLEFHQAHQLPPPPFGDNNPYHINNQIPTLQTYNIPIHGSRDNLVQLDNRYREPSVATLRRRANARDDGYTTVCGIFSPQISTPVKAYNNGKGDFCCPRCESKYTRPKSVKDHFNYCISKYGNPQALRYTDHPSMAQTEAAIQRRILASRRHSTVSVKEHGPETDMQCPVTEFRERREALARSTLPVLQELETTGDGTDMKTEPGFGAELFGAELFGAEIPLESIETSSPEHQLRSNFPQHGYYPYYSNPSPSQVYAAQTPEWQVPPGTNYRVDPSTPTAHGNPWNIGVQGSSTAHAVMDMRATEPFEGWSHASHTLDPINPDGIQNDGLDDFMDRRSYFSDTPATPYFPNMETL